MIDYVFPSKRKGQIECKRGKVLSNRKWNETRVKSYLNAINTTITDRGEVWLRYDDGTEEMIETVIPVAEGQDIILGFGKTASKKGNIMHLVYWGSISSNQRNIALPIDGRFFFPPGSVFKFMIRPFLLSVVIAVFVCLTVDAMYPAIAAFSCTCFMFIVSIAVTYKMEIKGAEKTFEKSKKKIINDFIKLESSLYSSQKK